MRDLKKPPSFHAILTTAILPAIVIGLYAGFDVIGYAWGLNRALFPASWTETGIQYPATSIIGLCLLGIMALSWCFDGLNKLIFTSDNIHPTDILTSGGELIWLSVISGFSIFATWIFPEFISNYIPAHDIRWMNGSQATWHHAIPPFLTALLAFAAPIIGFLLILKAVYLIARHTSGLPLREDWLVPELPSRWDLIQNAKAETERADQLQDALNSAQNTITTLQQDLSKITKDNEATTTAAAHVGIERLALINELDKVKKERDGFESALSEAQNTINLLRADLQKLDAAKSADTAKASGSSTARKATPNKQDKASRQDSLNLLISNQESEAAHGEKSE